MLLFLKTGKEGLRSDMWNKIHEKEKSLFIYLLNRFRLLFILLLAVALTLFAIYHNSPNALHDLSAHYPLLIAVVVMNFSVLKVILGFRRRSDAVIALAGTALFLYVGFISAATQPFVQEEVQQYFISFQYLLVRICWALFMVTVAIFEENSLVPYFILSYGAVLLLSLVFDLRSRFPIETSMLIGTPIIMYFFSMLALVGDKIMRGNRLLDVFKRYKRR